MEHHIHCPPPNFYTGMRTEPVLGAPYQWVREGTVLSHLRKATQGLYGISKWLSKRQLPEDLAEASSYYCASEPIGTIGISI